MLKNKNLGKHVRKKDMNKWRNVVEDYLYIMGIKNRHVNDRNRRQWRKTELENKVQNGL
jgi:hypothetical protein